MRRLVPCYALLVGLVFGACGVQVFVKPPPEPIRSEQTELWEREVLKIGQSGDWIVLRGYHDTDHLVAASTNMPVSHAVILDMDTRTIIEAVGSGIAEMRLRKRLHEAHRVLLIRPKWWTPKRGKQAVERARTQLGGAYDFLGTVGVAHTMPQYGVTAPDASSTPMKQFGNPGPV
jgi:hypothetical protein